MPTHYDILGVDHGASRADIKRAFRELAKKHHPDVNGSSTSSSEKFVAIQTAYEVLYDDSKRRAYDQQLTGHPGGLEGINFEHFFVASTSHTHVKLNDEVFIKFSYSGEGRIFRQPDFKGFHVSGKPFVHHSTVVKNGIPMKETSLTFTLAPLQKGMLRINPASIKIFNKQYATSPLGLYIEDNVCHFTANHVADGVPVLMPLTFEEHSRGPLFTGITYHRHDVLIPRCKVAMRFHWLGKMVKIATAVWVVSLCMNNGFALWTSLCLGISAGGINCQLMYKLAGVKSKFFHVRKYPLVQQYFSQGYYPRTALFAERDYNHVIYFITSIIF